MAAHIKEAAGAIYRTLSARGPMSKDDLRRTTGLAVGLANQAIGWLVRDGRVLVEEDRWGRQTIRVKG